MANPTVRDVHVDAVLTNMAVSFRPNLSNYISGAVFGEVPVDKMSDLYYVYDRGDWFRDEAEVRPPNSESAGSGYRIGTDTYTCKVWAFHKDIDDQTRSNYDNPIDPDNDAVQFVTQRMAIRQERDWADTAFKTGVWSTDRTGVASGPTGNQFVRWSDAASTPIEDVELSKETMLGTTGFIPNTLVLGYTVYRYLKQHPAFYNRIKYTTADNITLALMARLFEVDRVIVASSVVNTGNRNAGSTGNNSFSFIHGKHALLCYTNPNPTLLAPSAGYRFAWKGVSDGMGETIGVSRIPMPLKRSERIEAQQGWTYKVVAPDLGVFFSGAVV